jgi:hypothetical protein
MVRKQLYLIKAVKRSRGYALIGEDGTNIGKTIGYNTFKTRAEAYDACRRMYPSNSVWKGKKVASGYQIVVD